MDTGVGTKARREGRSSAEESQSEHMCALRLSAGERVQTEKHQYFRFFYFLFFCPLEGRVRIQKRRAQRTSPAGLERTSLRVKGNAL